MSYVEEVRELPDGRQHWEVEGPAGARIEWDAVITERRRPDVLAWCTEPGAAVEHEGRVLFDAIDGGTLVTVEMSYRPPGGAIGHGVAALLGRDPKQEMDRDLERMKAYIEGRRAPGGTMAATPDASARGEWSPPAM
jgi:uncharacterized membrane protein